MNGDVKLLLRWDHGGQGLSKQHQIFSQDIAFDVSVGDESVLVSICAKSIQDPAIEEEFRDHAVRVQRELLVQLPVYLLAEMPDLLRNHITLCSSTYAV